MAALADPTAVPGLRRLWTHVVSVQGLVSLLVLVVCGALVGYPVAFLIEASLNVGDPTDFPPTQFGLDNYLTLIEDVQVVYNTAYVAIIATVMAVAFGFLTAWTLTRTNVPWRGPLERLMELPFYLT